MIPQWMKWSSIAIVLVVMGCSEPAPTRKDTDRSGSGSGVNIKADKRGTDITEPSIDVKVKPGGGQ